MCGEQNDNLRSKTPPENSVQIFPSQFGSHSARVMMENRLHTRARARTHRAVIIVGQPCLFSHTTPVHKYAHRHIAKIIFLYYSIPKLVIKITQSIGGKHKHNNMYKRLTCIQLRSVSGSVLKLIDSLWANRDRASHKWAGSSLHGHQLLKMSP